jgi:hypothetical protein
VADREPGRTTRFRTLAVIGVMALVIVAVAIVAGLVAG